MTYQENIIVKEPDEAELKQFFVLRAKAYNEDLPAKPYPEGAVDSDNLPNARILVAVNSEGKVISGIRLNIINPDEHRKITFGDRTGFDVYDNLKKSGIDLEKLKHTELGAFVIDEKYRGGSLGMGNMINIMMDSTLKFAKEQGVDIAFICPDNSLNRTSERYLDSRKHNYLSFGSHSIPTDKVGFYKNDKKFLIGVSLNDNIDLANLKQAEKEGKY